MKVDIGSQLQRGIVKVQVDAWKCGRCEHVWLPRGQDFSVEPKVCPKCKSPYWNRERQRPVKVSS